MEAFLNGIMDEKTISNDLTDEECCMYASEGTKDRFP